jgi:hypothetical protein
MPAKLAGLGPARLENANLLRAERQVRVGNSGPSEGRVLRLAILTSFLLFLTAGASIAWMIFSGSGGLGTVSTEPEAIAGALPDHRAPTAPHGGEPPTGLLHEVTPPAGPASDLQSDRAPQPGEEARTPRTPLVPHRNPTAPLGPHSLHVASLGNAIVVTDRLTGKQLWRKNTDAPVRFLSFSPDGEKVISRDQQGETCTWDAASGNLEKREPALPNTVTSNEPAPKTESPTVTSKHSAGPEELRADLLKVKELDFYPDADKLRENIIDSSLTGTDFAQDQQIRRKFEVVSPPKFMAEVTNVLLNKAEAEGLPLAPRDRTRLSLDAARTMDALSKELRRHGFVSVPGVIGGSVVVSGLPGVKVSVVPQQQSAHANVLEEWCRQNRIERYAGAPNTFLQMLQVEDEPTRMILVNQMAKIDSPLASRILAMRATFDLSPEVRKASVEALRQREPETYRAVLLNGFRYPWALAADHAAEALTLLDDKKAIPQLASLLDKPDPCLPIYDDSRKTGVVHELVRINHMRNCFLCHAVSLDQNDLGRGAVPRAGQPLPQLYYNTAQADFVQADVTFLRQDFSVAQPVDNAAPWPTMQRFDYLVRARKATDAEMAELQNSPAVNYPQRKAVLAALRQLTGCDFGTSTSAWQDYVFTPTSKPAPEKSEAPRDTGPNPPKPTEPKENPAPHPALPEEKEQKLGVTVTSPDGKQVARAEGTTIRVMDGDEKNVLATFTDCCAMCLTFCGVR